MFFFTGLGVLVLMGCSGYLLYAFITWMLALPRARVERRKRELSLKDALMTSVNTTTELRRRVLNMENKIAHIEKYLAKLNTLR